MIITMTKEELLALANREATDWLGVDFAAACQMLDDGLLEGTIAEAEFTMLRAMLQ